MSNRPRPPDAADLEAFIRLFLVPFQLLEHPLAEDHAALRAAFHFYGISEAWLMGEAPAGVRRMVTEAFRNAVSLPHPPGEQEIHAAWSRLLEHTGKVAQRDHAFLCLWLSKLARNTPEMIREASDPGNDQPISPHDETFRVFLSDVLGWETPPPPDPVVDVTAGTERVVEPPPPPVEPPPPLVEPPATLPTIDCPPAPLEAPPAPPTKRLPEELTWVEGALSGEEWERVLGSMAEGIALFGEPDSASWKRSAEPTLDRLDEWLSHESDGLGMFARHRVDGRPRRILAPLVSEIPADLWFLGDVHGDLLALEASLAYVDRVSPGAGVVFLGDFFDDEGYGAEVLVRVLERLVKAPDRVCVLAGNHDEALAWDEDRFASTVDPGDFAGRLNAGRVIDPRYDRLGRTTIAVVERLPRALFLPDGQFAAHAGVPLKDLFDKIATVDDLESEACLRDFVWTRAHARAKTKIPNRMSRGAEFGVMDFETFCDLASRVLERPVDRMIRGHDHVDLAARGMVFPAYRNKPVVTINTMCRRLPREMLGPVVHRPCLARWVPGGLPELHSLVIPAELIHRFYPPEPAEAEEVP